MDNRQYVVIDGKPCIDITNFWLPPTADALVNLKAGEHHVQLVCKSSNTPKLSWKLTSDETTFRSPNAKQLDYVVFYGPSADSCNNNITGNSQAMFRCCPDGHTAFGNVANAILRVKNL